MLRNIPPLLTADALHGLACLGHGDEVVIADAHFPSHRIARQSGARLVELAGADAPEALAAVLSLLPLDDFEPVAAWTMAVVGDETAVPPPVRRFATLLSDAGERAAATLERHAFYVRAASASLILRTTETRPYGNILLRAGVLDRS